MTIGVQCFCCGPIISGHSKSANVRNRRWLHKWGSGLRSTTWIMQARPTLSGLSSIQRFTVFKAMSAAGSLGKPRQKKENKKEASIPVVYNMQIPEGDKNRQANKQKLISPKVMAFLLKSIESSTICSALADEHSCPFNCCRSLLPDAGWKKVLFLGGEESRYKLHVKTHLQASSGSIKPYSNPHFKQNWLRFCLDGDNYT